MREWLLENICRKIYKIMWLSSWDKQSYIKLSMLLTYIWLIFHETRDILNQVQLVICQWRTDECLMSCEGSIGLYQIDKADVSTIAAAIKDVLINVYRCPWTDVEVSVMMVAAQ